MKNKWLVILLIIAFIKGLIWLFFTPIFQIPDEPSHFSYIQFIAENNRLPHPRREVVSSRELFDVAQAINFNWKIVHPVWRGYTDDWQSKLKVIEPRQEWESNPELTALKRPVGYYAAAGLFYRLFANQPFLWRFFAVRIFSLLCQLLIIWLTFLIAGKITKNHWLSLAAAAGVGFHPGFSFIASGVSYEALAVLIVTVFIYLVTIKAKPVYLVLAAVIGILIKPDLIFLSLLLPWLLPKKYKNLSLAILLLLVIGFGLTLPLVNQIIRGQYPWLDRWLYFLPWKDYSLAVSQLFQVIFSGDWRGKTGEYLNLFFRIHYHQIFAWYWGVFGWLEKTLPPLVYTLLKILYLISLVGLFKTWRRVKWLILIVLIQAVLIVANDWLSFITTGRIYGIQGRYFYPAIGAQMILFIFGLSRFIPPKILIAGAVLLNLVGFYALYQYFGNVWQ